MGAKEPLVIDEFFGEYHGAKVDEEPGDRGVVVHIRPVADGFLRSLLPFLSRPKEFPYPLDPEKNIIHVDGRNEIRLRPTPDVPGLDYERTIWAQMSGEESGRIEALQEENEELEKEVGKLKKKVRKLRAEEEEKEKRKSAKTPDDVPCPSCGNAYSPQQWAANDGKCPSDDCQHVMHRYKDGDD